MKLRKLIRNQIMIGLSEKLTLFPALIKTKLVQLLENKLKSGLILLKKKVFRKHLNYNLLLMKPKATGTYKYLTGY